MKSWFKGLPITLVVATPAVVLGLSIWPPDPLTSVRGYARRALTM